jgi:hypothetical protein
MQEDILPATPPKAQPTSHSAGRILLNWIITVAVLSLIIGIGAILT